MKNISDNKEIDLTPNITDLSTALAKGMFGATPIAGPMIAEMVAVIVPNQRLDRVIDFIQQLEKRVSATELDNLKDNIYFVDLLEHAVEQSIKSLSPDRNQYLAAFIENNRNVSESNYSVKKKLCQTLEELTDDDIEMLRSKQNPFYESRFKSIGRLTIGQYDEMSDLEKYEYDLAQTSEDAHLNALERSKLISAEHMIPEKDDRDINDHIDRDTGLPEITGYKLTDLGSVLLKSIGLYQSREEIMS